MLAKTKIEYRKVSIRLLGKRDSQAEQKLQGMLSTSGIPVIENLATQGFFPIFF